jgi:hypothetical protein
MTEHALDDLDSLPLRDQLTATGMPQLVRRVARCPGLIQQPSRGAKFGPLIVQGIYETRVPRLEWNSTFVICRRPAQ